MTSHATKVFLDPTELEIELEVDLAPAEPDVGIMGAYVDDWHVTAVNGNTDKYLCADTEQRIVDELGEEAFIEQLYDEGVAED